MSLLIPHEKPQYRYTKSRFIDREFGVEFTKFENEQMRHFMEERKKPIVEITGYVSWLDDGHRFLLLPTKTVSNVYFICEVSTGVDFPDNNQYVSCKGLWKYSLQSKKTAFGYQILVVEEIQKSNPDFGIIQPDITYKDFVEILFERWSNVDENTQSLIAQSLVSSPTNFERAGGFTLSYFSLAKERSAILFASDLQRFVPSELLKNKPLPIDVRELGLKSHLPSFGWEGVGLNDNFDKSAENQFITKLNRVPISKDEYSISFFSSKSAPADFNSTSLGKSDYPVIFEEHSERKHRSYYTSPEIYKFMIATHMSSPEVNVDVYRKGQEISRDALLKKIKTDETLSKFSGNDKLLDLGVRGRPLSIINLAISYGRSDLANSITIERINDTSQLYLNNLEHITDAWNDLIVDKITPLASLNNDERRVLALLIDNGPSSIVEGATKLKMSIDEFSRIISSLHKKNTIYEYDAQRYASVIQN